MSKENQDRDIEREIKSLKKEIARLSALLAFKKLESDHPVLEKLATEIGRGEAAIKNRAEKIADFGRERLGDLDAGGAIKIFGRILLIGSIGYLIYDLLGRLEIFRR